MEDLSCLQKVENQKQSPGTPCINPRVTHIWYVNKIFFTCLPRVTARFKLSTPDSEQTETNN